ncbi:hypothetical protein [Kibdelosporangium philippinense]|uniref:hypothetical protein n=1 Tax=Kibdelosporangium philippinense TaxID=211113 RepID=UPI003607487C
MPTRLPGAPGHTLRQYPVKTAICLVRTLAERSRKDACQRLTRLGLMLNMGILCRAATEPTGLRHDDQPPDQLTSR